MIDFKPKYIRLVSDLHFNENEYIELNALPTDSDTVLVIAGDAGCICALGDSESKVYRFIKRSSGMFPHVIYLCGNHEFKRYRKDYDGNYFIGKKEEDYENSLQAWDIDPFRFLLSSRGINNVTILKNGIIPFKGVSFLCSTLWFDCNNLNQDSIKASKEYFLDTKQRPLFSEVMQRSMESKEFLGRGVERLKTTDINVLVTHYVPSIQLNNSMWTYPSKEVKDKVGFGIFGTDLNYLVNDPRVNLILYGHTHETSQYTLKRESGRFVKAFTNGKGVEGHNPKFNPDMVIDLSKI